jgi:tetratricopeptide (TPR) repeat protein
MPEDIPIDPAADRERRLDGILADYLAAVATGATPDRQAILDSHPDLEESLRAFFDDYDQVRRVARPLQNVAKAARGEIGTEPAAASEPGETAVASQATLPPGHPGSPLTTDFSTDRPPEMDGTDDNGSLPRGYRVRYFGDYELSRVLGRGGMGVVYKARQVSLNRPVALKMIRAGLWAGDEEIRRFRNEAEAIANLDHPQIVTVHEVGEHSGQHYFSMKLVEGPSLAERLEAYAAKPREAAKLVAEVARAVHHAHQRGILHRDLKPSNILLDREGRPHVTDFGLARKLEGNGSLSVSGSIVGTPSYMSPEQASGTRQGITTATDIYGLGALLYATLTGRPPFQADSVVETLRQVQEKVVEAPSRLNRKIDLDLETICLKCLDKDPGRRYGSAEAMAEDLERYEHGRPILARRTGPAERLAKWARRKPATAGLLAALLAALVVGVAGITWNWREAIRQRNLKEVQRQAALDAERTAATERDKARAVNDFLTRKLLAQADPENNPVGDKVTLLEVLDRAAAHAGDSFADQPEVEAAIQNTIAETYYGLGQEAKSERHFRRAVELLKRSLGPEHPETLRTINRLSSLLWEMIKRSEAEALIRSNVAISGRVLGTEHPVTLDAIRELARILPYTGSTPDEVEAFLKETLAAHQRVFGPDGDETLHVRFGLANLLGRRGRQDEQERLIREIVDATARTLGPDHVRTQQLNRHLAGLILSRGRPKEAEAILRRCLEVQQRNLGPDHGETLVVCGGLVAALRAQCRLAETEPLLRAGVAAGRKGLPLYPVDFVNGLHALGSLLIELGRAKEAEPYMVEALGIARTTGMTASDPPLPFQIAKVASSLGALRTSLGCFAEAEPLLIEAYELNERSRQGPASVLTNEERRRLERQDIDPLITLYDRWGKTGEAESWRLRGLDLAFPADPFAR